MNPLIIILLTLITGTHSTYTKKEVIGHWVSNTDLYGVTTGDTISLTKMKYAYDLYTWGKYPGGMEFKVNSEYAEYKNVMCSTESDNKRYSDETWDLTGGNVIVVKSSYREVKYEIIRVTHKSLMLKNIGYRELE